MTETASTLLQEICAQPACLRALLDTFPAMFEDVDFPGMFTQKLIGIAEGSSYNAFKLAAPYIEEFTGLNTFTFDPESLAHKFEIATQLKQPAKRLFERSYFLTVSQSGQTGSVLAILDQLQHTLGFSNRYSPLLAFTNNPQGTMATRYGNHVDLQAGEERSIAATKSMTASIMALLLFGLRLSKKRSWLSKDKRQKIRHTLQGIPEALSHLLDDQAMHQAIQAFVKPLCQSNQFILLSKGILSSVLPEAGLKLTETSSNIVWTDNTESFKHGRKVILQGVEGIFPNCVYLLPPKLSPSEAESFFHDVESHFFTQNQQIYNAQGVSFIRFENSPSIPESLQSALSITDNKVLTLPASEGIEAMFIALGAFQLLSHYLAVAKGQNPNHPSLQKAVTR